jgi:GT2 family glycosyltransferase
MASDITVVIVNYKSTDLREVLESLARQTRPADEVIVVDNSGEARELCRDVTYIDAGGNVGFAKANNLAAEKVRTTWMALLNHDAFAAPDWIEQLCKARDTFPQYGSFACRLVLHGDPTRLDGAGDAYRTDGTAWPRHRLEPVGVDGNEPREVFGGCGAAVMYRTAVFRKLGGFDERFFCYHEDTDLNFRLQVNGWPCLYVPAAMCRHVGSAVAGVGSDFSVYYGHRNMVWAWAKNHPRPWRFLAAHLVVNLFTMAWFTMKGRPRVIFKAKWDAFKRLPEMMRDRRPIDAREAARVMSRMENGNALRSLWRRAVSPAVRSERR